MKVAPPRRVLLLLPLLLLPLHSSHHHPNRPPARSLSDPLLFRSTLIVRMEIASSPALALSARP